MLWYLGSHLVYSHGLLLALSSGITPGCTGMDRAYVVPASKLKSSTCKARVLTLVLSSLEGPGYMLSFTWLIHKISHKTIMTYYYDHYY